MRWWGAGQHVHVPVHFALLKPLFSSLHIEIKLSKAGFVKQLAQEKDGDNKWKDTVANRKKAALLPTAVLWLFSTGDLVPLPARCFPVLEPNFWGLCENISFCFTTVCCWWCVFSFSEPSIPNRMGEHTPEGSCRASAYTVPCQSRQWDGFLLSLPESHTV